jgi:hypothetical protein
LNFWVVIILIALLSGSCSGNDRIEEKVPNDVLPALYSKKMSLIEEEYQNRYTKNSIDYEEGVISSAEYGERVIQNINWRIKKIDSMRLAIEDSLKQASHN